MAASINPRNVRICRRLTTTASLVAMGMGLLVLIGWWLGEPWLKGLHPQAVAMNPVTAVAFLLAGASLWLQRAAPTTERARRWAQALALAVTAIGALRIVEYLFGWGPHLDQRLFSGELERSVPPNRIAPNTAFAFVLVGGALWLLDAEQRGRRLAQALALATLLLAFLPAIGHLYQAIPFTRLGAGYIPMAVNTALTFLLLAVGLLCARPNHGLVGRITSDRLGGRMLRQLLPLLVLIPLLLGLFRLWSEQIWAFDKPFGVALITTGVVMLTAALLWWQAGVLNRLEDALMDRDLKLQALVNTSPDLIAIRDRDGAFLLANPAIAELLGLPPAELLGRRDVDLLARTYDDASVRHILESDQRVMASGAPETYEVPIRTVEGSERTFLSTKYPYRAPDGAVLGTITISRDITERERMAKALRENRQRMEAVVDNSPVFLFDLDASGRIMLARGLGLAPLALRAEDLVGRTVEEVFTAYPTFVASYHRAMAGEAFRTSVEVGDVAFDVWFTPLRDQKDEHVIGVLGVATDVSVRRRLEAQLRLNYEKLQELDRLKSDFVNAVSHDLRTPLTSILGYAEFLEDGMGGPITPQQREYVLQIERGSKRLEGMVNDMLDFARIDAGTFRLRCEETDLALTVQEVVDSLMPQIEKQRLALAVSVPATPLTLMLDPERIERVLANLIGNAIKFTPEGGRLGVRARLEGDQAVCEVEDSGIGIAAEDRSRLFQRFSQLEAGVRKKAGTGLGLSICKAIVEAHGGAIGVESEPGRGSTFWFRLPLRPSNAGRRGRDHRAESSAR